MATLQQPPTALRSAVETAGITKGSQLQVEAVWHQQVHQSRVSYLAVSEDGDMLFSGCDAAAPKPVEGPDVPAAAVSTQDGKLVKAYSDSGCRPHSIRLILSALPELVSCVNDQGTIISLGPDTTSRAAAEGCGGAVEGAREQGGQETAQAAAIQRAGDEAGTEQEGSCSGEHMQDVLAVPAGAFEALGPEFLAETGYRGVREGYLFRPGAKGLGYYRKDVVRLYAPTKPEAVGTGAASAGPDAAIAAGSQGSGGRAGEAAQGGAGGNGSAQQAAGAAEEMGTGASATAGPGYLQRLLRAPPSMQNAITSWDGTLLFTTSLGSNDHCIRVWRLPPPRPAAAATEPPPPEQEQLQPNREQQAGPGEGQQGQCCTPAQAAEPAEPPQPTLLRTLCGHSASVLSLALNPEGTLLFSGSHDYTIRAWSTQDWSCVRVLKGHGGGVRALAVSPDGRTLYSAAGDNTLRAWSTQLWVCLRTLHGRHEETTWPCCVALSPDGELLASGSNGLFGGSTIKVFQTRGAAGREAGACLATFAQLGFHQKGAVSALAFSRDGRRLYSGASDGTLAAWRLHWVEPAPAGRGAGLRRGFF